MHVVSGFHPLRATVRNEPRNVYRCRIIRRLVVIDSRRTDETPGREGD